MIDTLQRITVAFFDSDGVLFPNTVLMGAPYKAKFRSYYDGQGISLLRALGIRVVFITNEKGESAAAVRETVEKFNLLPSSKPQKPDGWEPVVLYEGCGGTRKLVAAQRYCNDRGVHLPTQASFMGDDLVDVALLKEVALAVAPAQAEEVVRSMCHMVTRREGGSGAIRDFANAVLKARNVSPLSLALQ